MKLRKKIMSFVGIILIVSIVAGYINPITIAYGYESKNARVSVNTGYKVNIRQGAGTSFEVLKSSTGSSVQLSNGHSVTIINEQNASDGMLWYNITFKYTDGEVYTGYIHSNYIIIEEIDYEEDGDFEEYLDEQEFPESYKEELRLLHAKYPNWVFVADHLDYEWDEVVKAESKLGRNLVYTGSISSWKSIQTGAFDWVNNKWVGFDSDSWVAASKEIIAYYLDPRNFLDEKYVFQFELLSYNADYQSAEGLANILSGTFMDGTTIDDEGTTYSQAIMDAAAVSGVSPYHLAASIIQEQGSGGGSGSISGQVAGYEGIYNYYNWGAYAANGNSAVKNGLIYSSKTDEATMRPWNTRYKSIVGGAIKKGAEYINIGQDTQYYIKFDFVGTPYTHQYMTNIQAAASEGYIGSQAYTEEMKSQMQIVFKIPVFENMPEENVPIPTKTGNPNNYLKELKVEGVDITPTFLYSTTAYDAVVGYDVSSVSISATAIDSKAKITGTGVVELAEGSNVIKVVVKAENGSSRTYTITIIREEAPKIPEGVFDITSEEYLISDIITGVMPSTNQDVFINKFNVTNGSVKVLNAKGEEFSGALGTGCKLATYDLKGELVKEYSIIVYGDVNGDGEIALLDLLKIKKHILGSSELEGVYATAANVNKKEDGITILDYLKVKKHILGSSIIEQ